MLPFCRICIPQKLLETLSCPEDESSMMNSHDSAQGRRKSKGDSISRGAHGIGSSRISQGILAPREMFTKGIRMDEWMI